MAPARALRTSGGGVCTYSFLCFIGAWSRRGSACDGNSPGGGRHPFVPSCRFVSSKAPLFELARIFGVPCSSVRGARLDGNQANAC